MASAKREPTRAKISDQARQIERLRRAMMPGQLANLISDRRTPTSKLTDIVSYIEGMKKDPWLAISQIRLIRMLMTGDWKIMDEKAGKPLPRSMGKDSPIVELFEKPNAYQSFSQLMSRLMLNRNIGGTAFLLEMGQSEGGTPSELFVLDSSKVTIVPDPKVFISHYKYQVGASTPVRLEAKDVHRMTYMENPQDPYWGMGIPEMAETHFNVTIAMEQWIWSLFVNGAIPGGVLTMKDTLDPDTFERLLKQFESRHGGSANAHKPMILENEAKYEPGSGPQEMDFRDSRKDRRLETLALAGVPPIRAGLTEDLNFASAYISDSGFIQGVYEPTIQEISDFFLPITRKFGPYRLVLPKLRPISDPAADATRVSVLVSTGILTPNEAREQLGMERVQGKLGMDSFYLTMNLLPMEESLMSGEQVPAVPGEKPKIELPLPFPDVKPNDTNEPKHVEHESAMQKATPTQRRVFRFVLNERRNMVRSMAKLGRAYFRWQGKKVVARFLEGQRDVSDLLDFKADETEWQRVTSVWFSEAMQEEYRATVELFGYDDPGTFMPGSRDFNIKLDRLGRDVTLVSQTTRDRIGEIVGQGVQAGNDPSQIAAALSQQFTSWGDARAELIARTESSRAMDQVLAQTYRDLNVKTVNIIGCEDNIIMPGETYGCNSVNIPVAVLEAIKFHPNHKGAPVPNAGKNYPSILTKPERSWDNPIVNRLLRFESLLDGGIALDKITDEVNS